MSVTQISSGKAGQSKARQGKAELGPNTPGHTLG